MSLLPFLACSIKEPDESFGEHLAKLTGVVRCPAWFPGKHLRGCRNCRPRPVKTATIRGRGFWVRHQLRTFLTVEGDLVFVAEHAHLFHVTLGYKQEGVNLQGERQH